MKPGVQLVVVGVLAAGAGLAGGYFLWGSGDGTVVVDRGSGLPIGRSPLLVGEDGAAGTLGPGRDAPAEPLSGSEEDLGFLGPKRAVAESIGDILEEPGPMGRWKEMMRLALEGDDAAVAAALEDLQELPQSIDTIVSKFFLYSRYAEGDPAAALDGMKDLSPEERDLASRSIMGGWAAEDPLAAAEYIKQFVADDGVLEGVSGQAVEALVHEWARVDPEAALEWGLDLKGETRDKAVGIALERWSWNDPEAAAAAALEMPADEKRQGYLTSIANNWAQRDPLGALSWAEGLPEGEREQAQATAVRQWVRDAPAAAAEYSWNMAEGESRDQAMRAVAGKWAESDPGAAAEWVLARTEGNNAKLAMAGVIYQWTKSNSMEASSWIAEQPPGPVTDGAIATLSNVVAARDPEGAAIWASSISDPKERDTHVKRVAESWLKKDPEAARAWISSAGISETVRAELLSK